MAIVLSDQLSYGGAKSNFERDMFETIADMKAFSTRKLPAMFITTCVEDGKIYLYNKNNENDDTYGKWRPVDIGSSPTGANIETYETVASMKEATVTDDNAIAFCTETEYAGLYEYNVNNESDETTGKWRKVITNEDIVPAPEGDENDIMYWGNILSVVSSENIPTEENYENFNDIFFTSLFQNSNIKSKNKIIEDFEFDVSMDETTAVNDLIQHFVAIPAKFTANENMFNTPYGKLNVGDATRLTTTVNEVRYDVFYWDICEGLRGTYTINLTL